VKDKLTNCRYFNTTGIIMRRSRPARLTRKESKAATRRRLLDAARAVFLREGFHAATVDAVAEEAGFTKGAVYSSFASKADLFLALYEERIERRAREFEKHREGTEAEPTGSWWAETLRRDRAWHLVLIEFWAFAARDDGLRRRFAALQARNRAALAKRAARIAGARGIETGFDADLFARAQAALGNGFVLEGFSAPEILLGDTYGRVAEALERGLCAAFTEARPASAKGGVQ
jgi:AcrR family transcriptional regulator